MTRRVSPRPQGVRRLSVLQASPGACHVMRSDAYGSESAPYGR